MIPQGLGSGTQWQTANRHPIVNDYTRNEETMSLLNDDEQGVQW
jgi:hypothetical protein